MTEAARITSKPYEITSAEAREGLRDGTYVLIGCGSHRARGKFQSAMGEGEILTHAWSMFREALADRKGGIYLIRAEHAHKCAGITGVSRVRKMDLERVHFGSFFGR